MNSSLILGVVLTFVAILPNSATALKCFKCQNEEDCAGYYDFRSDSENKTAKYIIDDVCAAGPSEIPACNYEISKEYVVRQRGCAAGVASSESFCTNRFKDVLICYCTTEFCNGIDTVGSAVNVAKEHFRRETEEEERQNKNKCSAAANTLMWSPIALITVIYLFCG